VVQQGQVFTLTATAEGEPLWAYRYRIQGRGSARLQVGGFRSRAEGRGLYSTGLRGWYQAAVLPRSRFAEARNQPAL